MNIICNIYTYEAPLHNGNHGDGDGYIVYSVVMIIYRQTRSNLVHSAHDSTSSSLLVVSICQLILKNGIQVRGQGAT